MSAANLPAPLAAEAAGDPSTPAPSTPRSGFVDALRGFALIGICVVNLPFMAAPVQALLQTPAGLDGVVQFGVSLLFEAKFFLLFSFLFGFGFAVQMRRIEEGRATRASFARRLLGLAVFGVVHAVLLFPGDILLSYAVLGTALWSIRHWPDDRLLGLARRLAVLAGLTFALLALIMVTLGADDPVAAKADAEAAIDAYRGTFAEALARRVQEWGFGLLVIVLFNWPLAFAAFCLGLVAGRRGLLNDPGQLAALLRPHLPLLVAGAVVGNLAAALFPWLPGWLGVLALPLLAVGAPSLSALYMLGLTQLRHGRIGQAVLRFLAPAGRMSLTNYVGQSVVANALFLGWGFGLYGQLERPALLLLALAIALALIALSRPWLESFASGPDEWLLRSWTALRWQPFRRRRSSATDARAPEKLPQVSSGEESAATLPR